VQKSHRDLVSRYGMSVSQMTTDMFILSLSNTVLSSFMTYTGIWLVTDVHIDIWTGAASIAGTSYPSGASISLPVFQWTLLCSIFSFLCSTLLFRLLITPLISSNLFSTYSFLNTNITDFIKYISCYTFTSESLWNIPVKWTCSLSICHYSRYTCFC
jgi:hypothetical protein